MPVTIATFAISGMVNANLPVPQPTSNHPVTVLKTTKSDQQRCKSAAVRYGPLGIRVDSVHPGYMPPMLNATNANERADKIALTPLRRLGEPIEVAYGVLFLASDEASFVTGAEVVIDGGYIAQ